jgi:putative NIF3 family GTP cyclohydrolase 1 type 2
VAWRDTTYRDTFKSGGPDTPVTGIATTVIASFDMIQRAVGAGLNMIVPHEVTFWNDRDDVTIVSADPLYKQKLDFLRIQLGMGYATPPVNAPEIDVVISGEQQEADGVLDGPEYVLDAAAMGIPKGWIMLGHAVSEESGMLEMAQWIKGFVPEVPVQLVKAGEPFWAPN